ncbi:MAG: hypothetical protein KI792_08870 [Alphaproteobacteria bacterium]|nr:hypothetical protein [Alphaproteobacteria bacterium SS10]
MKKDEILPLSLPPRGLTRRQAAAYIGIGTTKFDELVKDGRMPKPLKIDGSVRWDRFKIDEGFESLSDSGGNPWDR